MRARARALVFVLYILVCARAHLGPFVRQDCARAHLNCVPDKMSRTVIQRERIGRAPTLLSLWFALPDAKEDRVNAYEISDSMFPLFFRYTNVFPHVADVYCCRVT